MYLALYRKWRPKTFDEVCGQEHITKVLKNQVTNDRVSHAYLFWGSRGTGKTTTAKILAKAVNCEHPVNGNPCGHCAACKAIESQTAPDVLEIDAASNNSVENIRSLREEVVYPPSMLKKRVYIIDEVHMLSASAFNALLKTLEEPPPHVIFILATTELNAVPLTVLSRCIRFDFNRISEDVISKRLSYIAKEENINLTDEACSLLSRLADGALRDALSLLEACASGDEAITGDTVRSRLGISSDDSAAKLITAILRGNVKGALDAAEENRRKSSSIKLFIEDIAEILANLIVFKADPRQTVTGDKISLSDDIKAELTKAVKKASVSDLMRCASEFNELSAKMTRYSSDKKALMSMALIKLCDPRLSEDSLSLLARIEALERKVSALSACGCTVNEELPNDDVPKEEISAPEENPTEAVQIPQPEPKSPGTAKIYQQKAELLETLKSHRNLSSFLSMTDIIEDGNRLIIYADSFAKNILNTPGSIKLIEDAAAAVSGIRYKAEIRAKTSNEEHSALINELTEE